MLISKNSIVPTNNRNHRYFHNLGYVFNIGDRIEVICEHLKPNSRSLVIVKCDFCEKEKELKYVTYLENISNQGIYTCVGKCSMIKFKKTCLEKFGSEFPLQNKEIENKRIETNLRKYFPDFFLTDYNLIVEIKSDYTFNFCLEKNLIKKEYTIKNNYNFLFIIDKNYEELEKIIKIHGRNTNL